MLHRNRRKIRTFCRLCAKRRLFFRGKRAIIAGLRLRARLSETGVIMYRDLTKGNITKGLLLFALPMIAGNLLQQFYNIADTLIVGQALGKNALAAVGSAYTLMTFLTSIFLGLSMGAGALFSIYLGKKDYGALRSAVHHALVLIFAVTAALNVLVYAFLDPILRFLQIPDELYSSMREYLVIIFAGLIATFLYNFFACLLRAVGNSVAPLWFLGTSALLNIALDLLFVLVFSWGIAGAAIATSLSQLICAWLVIRTLQRAHGDHRLDLKKIRPDGWLLKRMLVIGLPAGISSVLYNITNVYVQKAINLLGTDTVAAWSVYWKLDGIFWPISNAIGIAVMTFAGQNYGARKKDRILQTMHVGIALHLAMCALIGGFIYFTRDWTIRLFNSDPAVVEQGRVIITYLAPCYFLFSATEVLSSMMRGVGNAVKPTIITLFGACVLRLILLFTMTFPHLSNLTIALCYPITWTAASVMFLLYYKFGKWLPAYPQKQPDIG